MEAELKTLSSVKVILPVQSNIIFATIPNEWIKSLQDKYYFYVIDEDRNLVRWVTSYDTTQEEIVDFINHIKQLGN